MPRSAFTDAYKSAVALLVELRHAKGVSQTELAKRLGRPQQFVSAIERSERRVDVVEYYAIVRALDGDPEAVFSRLVRAFPAKVTI